MYLFKKTIFLSVVLFAMFNVSHLSAAEKGYITGENIGQFQFISGANNFACLNGERVVQLSSSELRVGVEYTVLGRKKVKRLKRRIRRLRKRKAGVSDSQKKRLNRKLRRLRSLKSALKKAKAGCNNNSNPDPTLTATPTPGATSNPSSSPTANPSATPSATPNPSASPSSYEGFGTVTEGAKSSPIDYATYHVTSLANSGTGTLRDAVSQDGRYIVFDIGGTITLTNDLYIRSSYLTIDGSTAPSPGITVSVPNGDDFIIDGPANDIIINNIRADGNHVDGSHSNAGDAFGIYGPVSNVIVDHCTFTSAGDGVQDTRGLIENLTYSWNLFTKTAYVGSFSDAGGRHNISVHHNVYAGGEERIPKIKNEDGATTTQFDLVNNVVYGWGYRGLQIEPYGYHMELHVTNNYYEALTGSEDNAIFIRNQGIGMLVNYEGNIFPPGETDDVDTATLPPPIEAWARVTTYDANTLGDTVVPYVGTQYPTQEEQDLLNQIRNTIGGG